jgi:hypothetical protein
MHQVRSRLGWAQLLPLMAVCCLPGLFLQVEYICFNLHPWTLGRPLKHRPSEYSSEQQRVFFIDGSGSLYHRMGKKRSYGDGSGKKYEEV